LTTKTYDHYGKVPPLPRVIGDKKKRPQIVAVVDEDNCTGCDACVPFCPVDCIEHVPADKYTDVAIPPVQIRFNECIGCQICVRVCEKLTWNAIAMHDPDDVEKRFGIKIVGTAYGWDNIPDDTWINRKVEQHARK